MIEYPAWQAHLGDSNQNRASNFHSTGQTGKWDDARIDVWKAQWLGIYIYLIKEHVVTSIYFCLIKGLLISEETSCWAFYYFVIQSSTKNMGN